jgi:hypothetical protein
MECHCCGRSFIVLGDLINDQSIQSLYHGDRGDRTAGVNDQLELVVVIILRLLALIISVRISQSFFPA